MAFDCFHAFKAFDIPSERQAFRDGFILGAIFIMYYYIFQLGTTHVHRSLECQKFLGRWYSLVR